MACNPLIFRPCSLLCLRQAYDDRRGLGAWGLGLAIFLSSPIFSQSIKDAFSGGEVHGNFQIDAQYYNPDSAIGAKPTPEKMLMNGFSNIIYSSKNVSSGLRYESYYNAMQGFPVGYSNKHGIPYRYVTFNNEILTVTAGNYYEQFGSGLILRTWEERGLGYDNSLDGMRIRLQPYKGITLKGVIGVQRKYFDYAEGIVRGADTEINLNDLLDTLIGESKTKLIVGGSMVSKYQKDNNSQFNLPENVAAFAGRANLIHGLFNLYAEYAYKMNDPSNDNKYIYKPGEGLLVQASYSRKHFGFSVSAKRIDNMSFRSDRNAALIDAQINYLPALTKQHTYNLPATLYPYANQPNGELAYQAEFVYRFKKETIPGGKYGATITVNSSAVNNCDTLLLNDLATSRQGYTANYFNKNKSFDLYGKTIPLYELAIGDDIYFRDINVEYSRKISSAVKTNFMYAYITYNKDVIEGKSTYGLVNSHIGISDILVKFTNIHALRNELQALFTEGDQGGWAMALFEYTYAPNWFVAVMDQYNYGNHEIEKRVHYYYTSIGYMKNSTRITIGYGRQRAGIFCVGGVCRFVPAANGITLSVSSAF